MASGSSMPTEHELWSGKILRQASGKKSGRFVEHNATTYCHCHLVVARLVDAAFVWTEEHLTNEA